MNDASRTWNTGPRTLSVDVAKAGPDADRSVEPDRTEVEKQGRALIGVGLVGAGLAALCCATPVLAVRWPAIGLGAWLAGADRVLLPLLLASIGLVALSLVRRRAKADPS